jgi:hypothetical protein
LETRKQVARFADNDAKLGGWRKRKPYCNDKDTDKYLVRKRKLTSNWSFIAKEFEESIV